MKTASLMRTGAILLLISLFIILQASCSLTGPVLEPGAPIDDTGSDDTEEPIDHGTEEPVLPDPTDADLTEFEEPPFNDAPKTWYISSIDAGKRELDLDGDGTVDVTGIKVRSDARKINNTDNRIDGEPNVRPGDTILFRRGEVYEYPLILDYRGRADQPITIDCYGDPNAPKPVFRINEHADLPSDPHPMGSIFPYAITIRNGSNWVIRNIRVEHAFAGIYLRYDHSFLHENITIEDCEFYGINTSRPDEWSSAWERAFEIAYPAAIMVGGRGWKFSSLNVLDGFTVTDSTFEHCGVGISTGYWHQDWVDYYHKVSDLTITGNRSSDCLIGLISLNYVDGGIVSHNISTDSGGYSSSGICGSFVEFSKDLEICYNRFSGTRRTPLLIDGKMSYTWDGCGFDFESGCYGMDFHHNILDNNDGTGLLICGPKNGKPQEVTIRENLFINNCENIDSPDRIAGGLPHLYSGYEIFSDLYCGHMPNGTGTLEGNRYYRKHDAYTVTVGNQDYTIDYHAPAVTHPDGFERINEQYYTIDPADTDGINTIIESFIEEFDL